MLGIEYKAIFYLLSEYSEMLFNKMTSYIVSRVYYVPVSSPEDAFIELNKIDDIHQFLINFRKSLGEQLRNLLNHCGVFDIHVRSFYEEQIIKESEHEYRILKEIRSGVNIIPKEYPYVFKIYAYALCEEFYNKMTNVLARRYLELKLEEEFPVPEQS